MALGRSDEDENEDEDGSSGRYSSYNPIDNETPEERESRMKLVRELQKSFYKDEEAPTLQVETAETLESTATTASTIQNLPLWRVQWTELPGSQNVLNVHVPHYTNMFQKLLKGQSKKWGDHEEEEDKDESENNNDNNKNNFYFGHIFLPGGSENLDNPQFSLQEGDIGTLMRVSDSRQQSDGRLTLVVQALERFEIRNVVRSHSPYAIADVSVCVDDEQQKATTTIASAFDNHPFEYRTVSIDECEITSDDGTLVGLSISPLSNFDATTKPIPLPSETTTSDTDTDTDTKDIVAVAESNVWIHLDELLKLLRIASNGVGVPVPTQIMGLLPRSRTVLSERPKVVQHEDWPDDFALEAFVANMEDQTTTTTTTTTTTVGTYSKSPFVRVDEIGNENYSPLRRAQRLSYVVWTLTDKIALPLEGGKDIYGPETILGLTSTTERLELATEKIIKVCLLLKKVLRMQDE